MVVHTSNVGEEVRIDDNIVVRVVSVFGDRVNIGVTAPRQVRIVRGELKRFAPAPPSAAPTPGTRPASSDPDA